MADDDQVTEEFQNFVKNNREAILRILDIDPKTVVDRIETCREEIEPQARDQIRSSTDKLLKVVSDEEVQKHFINGCLELILCLEAAVRAMPKSPEMQEVVDNFEKTKKSVIRNAVKAGAKAETRKRIERINVTNVKRKIDERLGREEDEE